MDEPKPEYNTLYYHSIPSNLETWQYENILYERGISPFLLDFKTFLNEVYVYERPLTMDVPEYQHILDADDLHYVAKTRTFKANLGGVHMT